MSLAAVTFEPALPMVSAWGPWRFLYGQSSAAPSSSGWPANNQAQYFPIYVPTTCVATRMWWCNGATVNASYNVEAGVYLDAGYKPGALLITTGSVAQGTLNQVQFADITDTTLPGGALYWLYMSCSTTSATFFRTTLNAQDDEISKFTQASVGPGSAPATATPVESASTYVPVFGFSTTTIT